MDRKLEDIINELWYSAAYHNHNPICRYNAIRTAKDKIKNLFAESEKCGEVK